MSDAPGTPAGGAAEANTSAPNDAPGAASAVPGSVEPSAALAGAGAPTEQGSNLHGCPVEEILGATVVHCNREGYLDLCRALRADGYAMPVGVTGVDYLTHPGRALPAGVRPERFEVVLELLSLAAHRRVRVRCQVPAADPSIPSVFGLWPGVEAHERETYDMFGICFEGHPDPSRILMPDDWEGHPLRKDYDTGHIPVQFQEAPR